MNPIDLVVVIFFYIAPLLVSGIVVPIQMEKLSRRNTSLLKTTLISLMALIIPLLLLYVGNYLSPLIPGFAYYAFLLPLAFAGWGLMVRVVIVRIRLSPDDILIDLGRIESKWHFVLGIFIFVYNAILLSGMFLYTNWITNLANNNPFEIGFLGLLAISIPTTLLASFGNILAAFSKVYVTRYGFSRLRLGSLDWEDIKAYQWRGADDEKIELMLKTRYNTFLNIPLKYQAQVDDILKVEVGLELPSKYYGRIPAPAREQL